MPHYRIVAAVATAALLAGCGLGGPDYPTFSETSYRIDGLTSAPDGGAQVRTTIYRDGSQMRVETTLPELGEAIIVFDQATNAAYVLNPTGFAPAAVPAPVPAPSTTTGATTVPPTSTTTTTTPNPTTVTTTDPLATAPPSVVGVAVRVADANAPQPLETPWAALGEDNARSVGACEVAGEEGHEWRPAEETAGVERTACITSDGIVLRVRENERVIFEATSLQRGDQDDSLFGVPAGYQTIDPEAVARGVGETMEQLDSVSGAAPTTPAPAPVPAAPPPG